MNRHQDLTGASNTYEESVSIGSVEHNYFTVTNLISNLNPFGLNKVCLLTQKAYGSGSNLVILSSSFERVQIICNKVSDSKLKCVDCTFETGKVLF